MPPGRGPRCTRREACANGPAFSPGGVQGRGRRRVGRKEGGCMDPAKTTIPLIPSGMSVTLSPYRSGGVGTCWQEASKKASMFHGEEILSTDAEWSGQQIIMADEHSLRWPGIQEVSLPRDRRTGGSLGMTSSLRPCFSRMPAQHRSTVSKVSDRCEDRKTASRQPR